MRKQLLEFDDVANEQRKVIYHMRNTLLAADNIGETIAEFRQEVLQWFHDRPTISIERGQVGSGAKGASRPGDDECPHRGIGLGRLDRQLKIAGHFQRQAVQRIWTI